MVLTHSFFNKHSFIFIYSQALSILAMMDKDSGSQNLIMSSRAFLPWKYGQMFGCALIPLT